MTFLLNPDYRPVLEGDRRPLRWVQGPASMVGLGVGGLLLLFFCAAGIGLPVYAALRWSELTTWSRVGMVTFGLFFNLALAVIIWGFWTSGRKASRLLRHGQLVPGTIDSCVTHANEVTLAYRFTSPEGIERRGGASAPRPDLTAETCPPVGTPITVLYAGADCYEVL